MWQSNEYYGAMALTTVTLHGEILDPNGLTPAVGTVQFSIMEELRDVVDNIIYSSTTYTATLNVTGEFTLILPATDNPDLSPTNWVYKVWVNTDVWQEQFFVQLPFAPGITEFADLAELDFDPCTGTIAATPISPSESALFVRKTGDTMTGNLVINANLQVSGDANVDGTLTTPFTGVSLDVAQLLTMGLSTSIASGGELSLNVDPTKVDIASLTGYFVTYNSSAALSPTNPNLEFINAPAQIGITPTFNPSFYLLSSAGTLIQQPTPPTPTQRRTHLFIGVSASDAGIVVVHQSLPVIPSQVNNQLADLMLGMGAFSTSGNILSANGVNLSFNKTSGTLFNRAFSQVPNFQDPHNATLAAQTPVQFRHITGVPGVFGPLTSILDVANYDPGGLGVVTPIGGGANTSATFRIYAFANNTVTEQIFAQYGQNTYSSLSNAVAGIGSGSFVPNSTATRGALIGWISATRTATDLSNPNQAVFTKAAKFATA